MTDPIMTESMTNSMTDSTSARPEIIAHRGYSAAAPENTLAAVRAALDAGATSIEVDVRTAFDGTPVLFHDQHLGRTSSGVGPLRRRTVTQLRALDAGSWFSGEFAGERIPTLAEVLEELGDRIARFYPEVKGYREMEDLDRMISIIRNSGMLDRTSFISLDPIVLNRIRKTEPTVSIGVVVDEAEAVGPALDRCVEDGNAWLDMKAELLLRRPEFAASCTERNIVIGVWTVDDPEEADRLRELGITRFTTNRVSELLAWAGSDV